MPISVLIIEDHELLSSALRIAFAHDGRADVIDTVGSIDAGVASAARNLPDVVLSDRRLPDGDMDAQVGRVFAVSPSSRVVLMSGWPTQRSSLAALDAGVHAIVSKAQPVEQIIDAVVRVSTGDVVLPADLARSLVRGRSTRGRTELTRRELDILEALAHGESTLDAAARLHISHNTVRNHLARTMLKLGVHDRLAAVAEGIRLGLIDPCLPDTVDAGGHLPR